MSKIFTAFFLCAFLYNASAQCILNGTPSERTQTNVEFCVSACGCSEIEITGTVGLSGDWNLTSLGDITITIRNGGSLVFSGGAGSVDELFMTSGSVLIIENTSSTNALAVSSGGLGQIRIVIGTAEFKGNQFGSIIEAGGADGNGLLPVEFTRFEAKSKEDMVELQWTTASELNNDFFQIEHSRNGIDFFPVGKVKGSGTTTETKAYEFMHRQPINGVNYYRLKQVDFDGAFAYSDMVVVELNGRTRGVGIFPNPTTGLTVIQMADRPDRIQFNLINLVGQRIDIQPKLTDAGWEMDLSRLVKGIYLLRMDYDGRTVTRKIVKQ